MPSPFNPQTATNEDKGLIQIKVTGNFPVVKESPLSNILLNPSYTLPRDWATLAKTLASSSEETEPPGSNEMLWDIHGTPSEATTSNAGSATNDPLHDLFSRPAFSDFTSGETATVGPFDPQAADETLLSDGRINADDAPMPAMRVDVNLAANEGGEDLGGVGSDLGCQQGPGLQPRLYGQCGRGRQPVQPVLRRVHPGDRSSRERGVWCHRTEPWWRLPRVLERTPKSVHVLEFSSHHQRQVLVSDGMPATGAWSGD